MTFAIIAAIGIIAFCLGVMFGLRLVRDAFDEGYGCGFQAGYTHGWCDGADEQLDAIARAAWLRGNGFQVGTPRDN